VAGVVAASVFLGDSVEVFTRLESGEEVVAQVARGGAPFAAGQAVRVSWDAAEEMRFP
jgi:hypothetical protein